MGPTAICGNRPAEPSPGVQWAGGLRSDTTCCVQQLRGSETRKRWTVRDDSMLHCEMMMMMMADGS